MRTVRPVRCFVTSLWDLTLRTTDSLTASGQWKTGILCLSLSCQLALYHCLRAAWPVTLHHDCTAHLCDAPVRGHPANWLIIQIQVHCPVNARSQNFGEHTAGCQKMTILTVGVIFSVAHTDISRTTRLSSVCVHLVSHLTTAVRCWAAAVRWLNTPKLSYPYLLMTHDRKH